ncbi:MAG: hypothetical protein BVN35_12280 [Proteobacteria bacterium ST_bin11]|nr:MAG: hypothetical protein BVN35_12280 [Proteobacteria bacterium ST_bin11]
MSARNVASKSANGKSNCRLFCITWTGHIFLAQKKSPAPAGARDLLRQGINGKRKNADRRLFKLGRLFHGQD